MKAIKLLLLTAIVSLSATASYAGTCEGSGKDDTYSDEGSDISSPAPAPVDNKDNRAPSKD